MKSDYRKMRMILLFDLPTTEEDDTRNYRRFLTKIKKLGFYMLQYSVYAKALVNQFDYDSVAIKVNKIIPNRGSILILKLTEKQYANMQYLSGEQNHYDTIIGNRNIVFFKGDE